MKKAKTYDLSHGVILVTGGAGLIGSALIWALNRRGYDRILVADRLDSSDKWKNLAPLRFDDYIDADDLASRVTDENLPLPPINTVFHLGACSSTTETDAGYMMRNNFEYTKRLAEWAIAGKRRFIYASSAATYGGLEHAVSENLELYSLRPLNLYGYSKHLFDCYAARRGYLDRIAGLKYFNVFGPNEDHKGDMRSVVHKAFHQIRITGQAKLFKSYRAEVADGCQQRDFLYVKDAVEMTIHFAENRTASGLFNIGSGEAASWLMLVNAIFSALEMPPQIKFIEMPEELRSQYQYFTQARIDRLRASGCHHPITPLDQAVKDYVRNYLLTGRKLGEETATDIQSSKKPSVKKR